MTLANHTTCDLQLDPIITPIRHTSSSQQKQKPVNLLVDMDDLINYIIQTYKNCVDSARIYLHFTRDLICGMLIIRHKNSE